MLVNNGRAADTPVALVRLGTTSQQETVVGTLTDIVTKAQDIQNPAMIIVGEVVNLRDKISWFKEMSLAKNIPSVTLN